MKNRPKHHEELSDFTITPRVLRISAMAAGIGVVGAFVAYALLNLIELFTNIFFYQRWSFSSDPPAGHHMGALVILVPIVGAIIVGLMARYGSERIRGHGIPEAIESILMNGSRVEPKLAILKPVSSAVSIGSGGPFGAEGPIIMTGGAIGSLVAQFFHLTSSERKTLLVAGAAAGMSATFASPIAAVLLAVELLLFEWKPRSIIPVAVSSVMAMLMRIALLGSGPIFPVVAHTAALSTESVLLYVLVGGIAGIVSSLLTYGVYASEDLFQRLPIHWMWWPAIGGLGIGIGGLLFPEALGVGYQTIGELLRGDLPMRIIVGVLLVKSVIWAIALGSGTSGGVLAPLLMIGCALGGLESLVFPPAGAGFWPLISMGAILGGTMRLPFTAVLFSLELTHDFNSMLPLFIAVAAAYTFSVLTMKRSILTEKISRRGYHLSREYSIDPLEITFVRDVMRTEFLSLPLNGSAAEISRTAEGREGKHQRLFPVLDPAGEFLGVVTSVDLLLHPNQDLKSFVRANPVTAFADEPLRVIVYRMAESGRTRLPVLDRSHEGHVVGIVSLADLLGARSRVLKDEQARERLIRFGVGIRSSGVPAD